MVSVGSATVDILPDMSRFASTLGPAVNAEVDRVARGIGAKFSQPITDGIIRGVNEGFRRAPEAAGRSGASSGGTFADAFKAHVDEALRSLPDVKVTADSSDADRKIAGIRAELEGLSNTHVGVDVSAEEATAAVADIKARLDELGAKSESVQVKSDTADASARLDEVRAKVDSLSGDTATVRVQADTSEADAAIAQTKADAANAGDSGGVGIAGILAGASPLAVPLGAAGIAGAAGAATAAVSGAAGLGVLAIALKGATTASGLLQQQQNQQASSAVTSATASVAAANQIKAATAALSQAREVAGNQAITAAQAVATAEQGLGNTEQSVSLQRAAAAQTVANAEYALTQANQTAANAQNALNTARETAARDLESAANRQVDAGLAAKQAVLSLETAQQTYAATLASGTATDQQKQQAALNLASAQQHLIEANQAATQATQDNTVAQQNGVAKAPVVVSAVNAIAAAQHGQKTAAEGLANAQSAQARQSTLGAQQIAAAELAVQNAQRAQSQSAEQGAYSVARAQQSLVTAQQSAAKAGQGGAAAMASLNTQLAQLGPATIAFGGFLNNVLQPAFAKIQSAAAEGLLPGVQKLFEELAPLIPPFTAFVGQLASTIGGLLATAGTALQSPFWKQFFGYLAATAGPTIVIIAKVIGDLATGFAGLLMAFKPVADQVGAGVLALAGKFATFAENLSSNKGFQAFLGYIEKEGPVVADAIGKILLIVVKLIPGLAPLGALLFKLIDYVLSLVASLSPGQLLGAIAAVGLALTVLGGPVAGVIVGVTALVAGLVYAYQHSKKFRDFINDHVLPILRDLWDYLKNTVYPILKKIAEDALQGLTDGFHIVSKAISDHRGELTKLGHAFKDIGDFIVQKILPILGPVLEGAFIGAGTIVADFITGLGALIDTFTSVVNAAKTAWPTIKSVFADGVNGVIDIINTFIRALDIIPGINIKTIQHVSFASAPDSSHGGTAGVRSAAHINRFAAGGSLPPFVTNGPRAIVGEGNPAFPEFVIPTDPTHRKRAVDLYGQLGGKLMAHGGILGAAESVAGAVVGGAESVGGGILGLLSKGFNFAVDGAASVAKSLAGVIPSATFRSVADGVINAIAKAIEGGNAAKAASATPPGGSVERWGPDVAQVLSMLGQPSSLVNGILQLISHESGGNPTAINLTDSNAQAGHPSQGLMQTIPGTFEAYRSKSLPDNITDPLANIFAGVSYALANYGPGMLAAGGRHDSAGNYIGYDSGGLLQPGYTMAYNGTGAPEAVLTPGQFAQMGGSNDATLIELKMQNRLLAQQNALLADIPGSTGAYVADALNANASTAYVHARGGRMAH